MRAIILIMIMLITIPIALFAADSLNISLEMAVELNELRGVDTYSGYIYAFAKEPKLYSIEYVCGGGLFVVDSLTFDGFSMASHTHLSGRWIECASNRAFLADWSSGFHVVNIMDPLNIVMDATETSAMLARAVYPKGDSLFVCSGSSGLHLYAIAAGPTPLTSFEPSSFPMDAIGNSSGTVWLAESETGFSAWNLDDTSAPLSFLTLPGDAVRIEKQGDLVFIAAWESGIHIIDVSDIEDPTLVTTIDFWDDFVYDVEPWEGNRLLVAAGEDGFSVVNLGSGAAITEEAYYVPDDADIIDISYISDKAYAADEHGMLYCFDLTDLSSIVELHRPDDIAMNLYPNPFNSTVRIEITHGKLNSKSLQIFGIDGSLIDELRIANNRNNITWEPGNEIGSGIYLVKLSGTDTVEKLILIK